MLSLGSRRNLRDSPRMPIRVLRTAPIARSSLTAQAGQQIQNDERTAAVVYYELRRCISRPPGAPTIQ